MIDDIDIKILNILQTNARTSNAEIARQIKMVPSGVLERIRRLEKKGVILGYEARINPKAVQRGQVIYIFVKDTLPTGKIGAGEALAGLDEVLEVHSLAGEESFIVKLRVKDIEELGEIFSKKIGPMEMFASTRSIVVIRTLKETMQLPLRTSRKPNP